MRCNCFPIITALVALISVLSVFFGSTWCRAFTIQPHDTTMPTFETGIVSFRTSTDFTHNIFTGKSLEYWGFRETCQQYVTLVDHLDTTWRIVVALQVTSWVMGMLLSLLLVIAICCRISRQAYSAIAILYFIVCCPASALMFLIVKSSVCTQNPVIELSLEEENSRNNSTNFEEYPYENSCKLGRGSILFLVGVAGFFITGILTVCLAYKAGKDEFDDADDNDDINNNDMKSLETMDMDSPSVNVYKTNNYSSDSKSVVSSSSTASKQQQQQSDNKTTTSNSVQNNDYDDNPFTSA